MIINFNQFIQKNYHYMQTEPLIHFRERPVTATFQMKKQSPFATVLPMSYELWARHI